MYKYFLSLVLLLILNCKSMDFDIAKIDFKTNNESYVLLDTDKVSKEQQERLEKEIHNIEVDALQKLKKVAITYASLFEIVAERPVILIKLSITPQLLKQEEKK